MKRAVHATLRRIWGVTATYLGQVRCPSQLLPRKPLRSLELASQHQLPVQHLAEVRKRRATCQSGIMSGQTLTCPACAIGQGMLHAQSGSRTRRHRPARQPWYDPCIRQHQSRCAHPAKTVRCTLNSSPSPEVRHDVFGLDVRQSQVIPQLLIEPKADDSSKASSS